MNLNTYIVRVYRRKSGTPRSLVGIVEKVGKKQKKAFANLNGLWDILNSRKATVPRRRGSQKKDGKKLYGAH